MLLIIHRGTKEIGGSCVELLTANNRILIDFGIPLVTGNRQPFDINQLKGKTIQDLKVQGILPDIKGLYRDEEKGIDGILISHSHLDHYGFLQYVNPEIPIYLSQGAGILIDVSNIFVPTKVGKLNTRIISNKKRFNIGDFTVTPFLVDHSAFDAQAFLIEAEGKRIFYSGDFRAHGRKAALFKQIITKPPQNIDCLLMEGSTLGREDAQYKTEEDVEKRVVEILRERKNITFLFASSQNIDRLVSAYRACLKTDSIFVIDIYTAFILDKLKKVSERIPQFNPPSRNSPPVRVGMDSERNSASARFSPRRSEKQESTGVSPWSFNWKNVRVKFLKAHAEALVEAGYRDLLYAYNKRKIDMFEINRNKNRVLMLARKNSVFPILLKKIKDVSGAKIAYSMWDGYISKEFRAFCEGKGLTIEYIHTSGHARPEDLKAFASAMDPKMLIPIHTFEPNSYLKIFKNVKLMNDGEVLDLNTN